MLEKIKNILEHLIQVKTIERACWDLVYNGRAANNFSFLKGHMSNQVSRQKCGQMFLIIYLLFGKKICSDYDR